MNIVEPGVTKEERDARLMSMSDEELEKYFERQEQINQRVYARSRTVLSQDQLDALGAFQTNQLKMQRFGMDMARKMMGGEKPSAGPPAK